jgi:hypothetical protein
LDEFCSVGAVGCPAQTVMSFKVSGIKNPNYINQSSVSSIVIKTMTPAFDAIYDETA